MSDSTPLHETYTISEAAALTGRHPNTIRGRIRLGQLEATIHQGKFGEEYRISRDALIKAGLLNDGDLGDAAQTALEADIVERNDAAGADGSPSGGSGSVSADTLVELFQRHEQAMFRLGFLQGELERVKALAESAESLRKSNEEREEQLAGLRAALDEREQQAREAERLRRELERQQDRLQEMEALRQELAQLKTLAAQTNEALLKATQKRPWWQFWKN